MTPQQKADKLIEYYKFISREAEDNLNKASEMALICVQEIQADHKEVGTPLGNKEFWNAVKEAIENLLF